MNQEQMIELNREEARKRNEDLKKQAAERLRKNAEYNRKNKTKAKE